MRVIASTPLSTIRSQEQMLKAKDAQLQQLGLSLTQEKISDAQKDTMIGHLGKEITQLKIKVSVLEGAADK